MKNFRRLALVSAASLAALSMPAFAAGPNLVSNGGFETNTGNGEVDFNTTASPWTVPGATAQKYTFLWNTGAGASGTTADTTGALGSLGTVRLWGPGTLSANGLTLSPNGGAFVGADGAFQDEPIQQTISGLVAGHTYALTFDWAAAQQFGLSRRDQFRVGREPRSGNVFNRELGHWEPVASAVGNSQPSTSLRQDQARRFRSSLPGPGERPNRRSRCWTACR